MDQRTRKLITMYKALHPRNDLDDLCVSRKERGRGIVSIEKNIDASIQGLKDYIKKAPKNTCYNHQKQYRQHKHQQNKNIQKK